MRGQSPQQEAGRRAGSQPCTAAGTPAGVRSSLSPPLLSRRVCLGNASVHLPVSLSHSIHAGGLRCLHCVCSAPWPLSVDGICPAGVLVCLCPPAEPRLPSCLISFIDLASGPHGPFLLLSSRYLCIEWPAPHLLCPPLSLESAPGLAADLPLTSTPRVLCLTGEPN